MSLSDRLVAAARVREAARTGQPLAPSFVEPDTVAPADAVDITVFLQATTPAVAIEPDPAAEPGSLCPSCHRPGQIGLVDLGRQTTDYQCTACGAMWRSRDLRSGTSPAADRLAPPMRG